MTTTNIPEVVEDPELIERYGIRKTEVMAFGCTSRSSCSFMAVGCYKASTNSQKHHIQCRH
ncbi:hypothetical protein [Acinetobacter baumannii]|uniref:hypothetical protein n=1 Tax=Acinetobacter baumannii TaxID=470 RepID=UPI001E55918E|nr:hypothetical protein [Acinetobacter baumannii]